MAEAFMDPLISYDNEPNNEEVLKSARNLWIVINVILALYAIGLFVYGKYFRKRDVAAYVFYIINKLQKNYIEDKNSYSRTDSGEHLSQLGNIKGSPNEKLI